MITVDRQMVSDSKDRHRHHATMDPLPAFTVRVIYINESSKYPAIRALSKPEVRKFVTEWCDKNCMGRRYIGHKRAVHFDLEEDALLFWMTFQ